MRTICDLWTLDGQQEKEEMSAAAELKFVSQPDDGLKCLICLDLAREPQQHEACGKLFCNDCLEKYGRDKPCPNCRKQDSQYYTDNRSKYTQLRCKKGKVDICIALEKAKLTFTLL